MTLLALTDDAIRYICTASGVVGIVAALAFSFWMSSREERISLVARLKSLRQDDADDRPRQ